MKKCFIYIICLELKKNAFFWGKVGVFVKVFQGRTFEMKPWDEAEEVESPEMKLWDESEEVESPEMRPWDEAEKVEAPEMKLWDQAEEVESSEMRLWDGAAGEKLPRCVFFIE